DSLTMFVSFLLAGRFLEMRMRHRAERALEDSIVKLPQAVERLGADGQWESVSALRLAVGDTARVRVGDVFAADGVVTQGSTHVDEALLTGESAPVLKQPGRPVVAGSVNLGAPVQFEVRGLGADTRYEQILALMRCASALARRGLLLRRLDAIAGLARMQVLFTDKTGTLTRASLQLERIERLGEVAGLEDEGVCEAAAALARWSSHPASRSLV